MNEEQHEKEKSFIAKVGAATIAVVGVGCYICGVITGIAIEAGKIGLAHKQLKK